MLKKVSLALLFLLVATEMNELAAQNSEIGVGAGLASYRGDLNPDNALRKLGPSVSLLYRYTVSDYVQLRAAAAFGIIGGADSVAKNSFQQARNLSFRSSILELSGQLDLHFKRFVIGDEKHFFTPYLTTGISVFKFNPRAKYNDEWYSLHEYGTEGQKSDFSGNKPYKLFQPAILVGGGFKYWMRGPWSVFAEVVYRKTYTDYLDDVSKTYVNNALLSDPIARALADRSVENPDGEPIGETGRQRGDVTTKDGYSFLTLGVTYTIVSRRCPTSK